MQLILYQIKNQIILLSDPKFAVFAIFSFCLPTPPPFPLKNKWSERENKENETHISIFNINCCGSNYRQKKTLFSLCISPAVHGFVWKILTVQDNPGKKTVQNSCLHKALTIENIKDVRTRQSDLIKHRVNASMFKKALRVTSHKNRLSHLSRGLVLARFSCVTKRCSRKKKKVPYCHTILLVLLLEPPSSLPIDVK